MRSHTSCPTLGEVLGLGLHLGKGCPLSGLGGQLQALPVSPPALQTEAPGNATSATLGPLSSSTTYTVRVTCLYPGGSSSTMTGRLTTREWAMVRLDCIPLPPWMVQINTYA